MLVASVTRPKETLLGGSILTLQSVKKRWPEKQASGTLSRKLHVNGILSVAGRIKYLGSMSIESYRAENVIKITEMSI